MAALSCEKCLKPPELGMSLLLCRSVGTPCSQFTFDFSHNYSIAITVLLFISTEGALRLPTTSDNHPIQPIQPVRHIALNELNRPKIDLS